MKYSDILYFPSFLSEKECRSALEIFDQAPILPDDLGVFTGRAKIPFYGNNINKKITDDQVKFSELFFNKKLSQSNLHTLIWNEGTSFPLHSDYREEHAYKRDYVGLIYLNQNFEGGVLKIPKLNVTIKPKTGLFVCFRGGDYMHEVTPILKGKRYVITCWMTEI